MTIGARTKVAEIGCGPGGNLEPFLDRGCFVTGIDRDASKAEWAKKLLSTRSQNCIIHPVDFFTLEENDENRFHLILLHDTIEHMEDKDRLVQKLQRHLLPGGILYIAFPPWRMPFGGHHQICRSRFLSKLPWFHLLPRFLYFGIMKTAKESSATIRMLRETCETGISIGQSRELLNRHCYQTIEELPYLINPHYEIKSGLKPRLLPVFLRIPWLMDFYTTSHSIIVRRANEISE